MIVAVILLVSAFAIVLALCEHAQAADLNAAVHEYEELEHCYRSADAPRCICGEVLRIEDWRFDRCPTCRGRLRERKEARRRRGACR